MIEEAQTRLARIHGHLADLDTPGAAGTSSDATLKRPNA